VKRKPSVTLAWSESNNGRGKPRWRAIRRVCFRSVKQPDHWPDSAFSRDYVGAKAFLADVAREGGK
jgi:hypothetical protein